VIEPLLALPANMRERLISALEGGYITPPYSAVALRQLLGDSVDCASLSALLGDLDGQGVGGPAVAFAINLAERTLAAVPRADLVWSGPEVAGLHARDTRRVYEELVAGAERSLWICAYTYYDGPKAFKSLAQRIDAMPGLQATLLLNIQRRHDNHATSDELVRKFAERLWKKDWPGSRQPDVFYNPQSLDPEGSGGVLHAKAIIADDESAFVTSANLTEAAFDRNIEVGVLTRDRAIAASLSKHFRVLIDQGLLLPLPAI
jgi:phosphatidylserine/phosphatidylglycerophosphate/cardiolipin synthase-like enzyme